ncbi:hypothetical protein [Nonlabens sp. YIK11]|uniref:hypothetical protein n=1 Tax=Nonlabens sp. YIK11 TaxID=1453349 RepID=UPI0006DC3267|nr:hypothetical protein [Nonlabens sp. YIK11]
MSKSDIAEDLLVIEKISEKESALLIPEIVEQSEEFIAYKFDLVIVQNSTGLILSQLTKQIFLKSDATKLYNAEVDYNSIMVSDRFDSLSVIIEYYGSSRVNPHSSKNLYAFERVGDEIKTTLEDFVIHEIIGENDGGLNGSYKESKRLVTPWNHTQHHSDLRIQEVVLKSKVIDGDEEILSISKNDVAILKYSNGSYYCK